MEQEATGKEQKEASHFLKIFQPMAATMILVIGERILKKQYGR